MFGLAADEFFRMGPLGRLHDLCTAKRSLPKAILAAIVSRKEKRFLRDKGDLFAQRFLGVGVERLAIDADLPFLHFIKTRQELDDGRFPDACRRRRWQPSPLFDSEADIFETHSSLVAEPDVVKFDVILKPCELDRHLS